MDKRFQVFVSSTFNDLREERSVVTSALLQLDCFPAGMELFPAADDDSLTLIKTVIDDSDYYLIILAGRYGSLAAGSDKSFTHLEYEYALATGKPTIALLHSEPSALPAAKGENSDDGRKKFEEFRSELRKKNCKLWSDLAGLTVAVFTGVQHLKRTRPSTGWVKGSELPDEKLKDELLQVRRERDILSVELERSRRLAPPAGNEELARGAETTTIGIDFPEGSIEVYWLTWEQILRSVLPQTLGVGASEVQIAGALKSLANEKTFEQSVTGISSGAQSPAQWRDAAVSRGSFGKVMNQMVALGLVEGVEHPNKTETLWRATPYGAQAGCSLLAERRA